jgi:hypothetical protein
VSLTARNRAQLVDMSDYRAMCEARFIGTVHQWRQQQIVLKCVTERLLRTPKVDQRQRPRMNRNASFAQFDKAAAKLWSQALVKAASAPGGFLASMLKQAREDAPLSGKRASMLIIDDLQPR